MLHWWTTSKKVLPTGDSFLWANIDLSLGPTLAHWLQYSGCIYLFGVLRRFQHCTGHITMGSWKGRGNQYIQFVTVLYCKLPTNGKQLPAFPLETVPGIEARPQRWEVRVLPLCHRGPYSSCNHTANQIAVWNYVTMVWPRQMITG